MEKINAFLVAVLLLGCSVDESTWIQDFAAGGTTAEQSEPAAEGGAAASSLSLPGGNTPGGQSSNLLPVTAGTGTTEGSTAVGGSSTATGGKIGTGGATQTSLATGGLATGGTVATGGSRSTGGAVQTGVSRATGGSVATGGSKATGGSVATGGDPATGGTPATGGAAPNGGASAADCASVPPTKFGGYDTCLHVTNPNDPSGCVAIYPSNASCPTTGTRLCSSAWSEINEACYLVCMTCGKSNVSSTSGKAACDAAVARVVATPESRGTKSITEACGSSELRQ